MRLRLDLSPATWALLAILVAAIAGVTHAVSVLALPWRSANDAFTRVAALVQPGERATLGDPARESLPFSDPALLMDVCRFDLGAKPFRLALSPLADGFVTIGFHSRHGIAFYGLNVRASDATAFDLVVERQGDSETNTPSEQDGHRVIVVAPETEGFVTLATPLGDGTEREAALDRLGKIECRWDATPAS